MKVVAIQSDEDIVTARLEGRMMAERVGFQGSDLVIIATAISEIARNILEYARQGEIVLSVVQQGSQKGIQVVALDSGPGIADLARVMHDGFSTKGGLGLGLPGARRLVDEFEIASEPGKGTMVTMKKWRR